jgi:NAD(P)-dependent dehydrogenase (short-subunit alcohol dehydrogenase family)
MFSFENKSAFIIGAGRNIGRVIALEFARRGARVAVADIDKSSADETAQMITAAGGKATGIACDVMSEGSVRDAVSEAERYLGNIDIHMNNAGIIHSGNPEEFPASEWERMFSVNFFGAVRANAIVLPKMIARGRGYIVNTASFAGLYPYATNRIAYAASKAALISMSENLAVYLIPKGILVSCLCPGPTMTTSTVGKQSHHARSGQQSHGEESGACCERPGGRHVCRPHHHPYARGGVGDRSQARSLARQFHPAEDRRVHTRRVGPTRAIRSKVRLPTCHRPGRHEAQGASGPATHLVALAFGD